MNLNGFKRTDRWIVGLAGAIFIISLSLILNDRWLIQLHSDDVHGLEPIGTLTLAKNDVRRRVKAALIWLPIETSQEVYQGDRIFTGGDSEATVKTHKGDEILISANSLIVINFKEDSILLGIDYGGIKGTVTKDQKLLIASKDGVMEFTGREAVIDVQVNHGKALKVNVIKGEVKVKSQEKTRILTEDSSADVSLPKLVTNPINDFLPKGQLLETVQAPQILYPKPETEVVTSPDKLTELPLKWMGKSKNGWIVELSEDGNFADAKRFSVNKQEWVFSPPAKDLTYHWRVKSRDSLFAEWQTSSFKVIKAAPPEEIPKFIFKTSTFVLESKYQKNATSPHRSEQVEKLPLIRWTKLKTATEYELQLSQNKNFKNILFKNKTSNSWLTWNEPKIGSFFARVRAINKGAEGSFSQVVEFKTEVLPPASLTQLEFEEEVPDLNLVDMPPPPFDIRWAPTVFTSYYELQFSDSPDYKKSLNIVTASTQKKVQAPKSGTYYWRVRSLDKRKKVLSDFSKSFKIKFSRKYMNPEKDELLRALYPKQLQSIVVVGSGNDRIQFRWTKPYKNVLYRVQLSSSSDFGNLLLERLVEKNWALISADLPSGWVYWRLRAEAEGVKTAWTRPQRFELIHQSKGFNLNSQPVHRTTETKSTTKTRSPAEEAQTITLKAPFGLSGTETFRVVDGLNDSSEAPKLGWQILDPKLISVIEVAKDPEFKELTLTRDLPVSEFEWKSFTPGTYYWKVAAKDFKGKMSPFSEVKKLEIILPPPESKVAVEFTEHFPYPRAAPKEPKAFALEWSKLPFAASYALEFAKDKEFKQVVRIYAKTNSEKIKVSKTGVYYWRVRALDKSGIPITGYSQIYRAEVGRTYTSMISPPPIGFPQTKEELRDRLRAPAEK